MGSLPQTLVSAEQVRKQWDQDRTDEGHAAPRNKLLDPLRFSS